MAQLLMFSMGTIEKGLLILSDWQCTDAGVDHGTEERAAGVCALGAERSGAGVVLCPAGAALPAQPARPPARPAAGAPSAEPLIAILGTRPTTGKMIIKLEMSTADTSRVDETSLSSLCCPEEAPVSPNDICRC